MKNLILAVLLSPAFILAQEIPVSECGSTPTGIASYGNYRCGAGAMQNLTPVTEGFFTGQEQLYIPAGTTVAENTAVGVESLRENRHGSDNTCSGSRSCRDQVNAYYNACDGHYACGFNLDGIKNTCHGTFCMRGREGVSSFDRNTGDGFRAMYNLRYGIDNVCNGHMCMVNLRDGLFNVCDGSSCMLIARDAEGVVAYGRGAGYSIWDGKFDSFFGDLAGWDIKDKINNTIIGSNTGISLDYTGIGDSNTIIGANVQNLTPGLANNIIISDGDGNIKAWYNETGWTFYGNVKIVGTLTHD